jgi:hypothetical protein
MEAWNKQHANTSGESTFEDAQAFNLGADFRVIKKKKSS